MAHRTRRRLPSARLMTAIRLILALVGLAGVGVGILFTGSLLVIAGRASREDESRLERMRSHGDL